MEEKMSENKLNKTYNLIDISGIIKQDAVEAFNKIIPHLEEKYNVKFNPIDNPYEHSNGDYSITGEYTYKSKILRFHKTKFMSIYWGTTHWPTEKHKAEFTPFIHIGRMGMREFSTLENLDKIVERYHLEQRHKS